MSISTEPTLKIFLYEKFCVKLYGDTLLKFYDRPVVSLLRQSQTGHFNSTLKIINLGFWRHLISAKSMTIRPEDLSPDLVFSECFDLKQSLEYLARLEYSLLQFYLSCVDQGLIEKEVLLLTDELLIPNQRSYVNHLHFIIKLEGNPASFTEKRKLKVVSPQDSKK